MDKKTKHYCIGCKTKHEEESWRWHTKRVGRKTVYWCHLCIDCYGCREIHKNETGYSRSDSRGWLCGKWAKSPPPSFQKKIQGYSTEEVLSGSMHGLPNQFQTTSQDYTPQVKQEQRRRVLEALT